VFTDGAGTSEDSSPDEDSYLNLPDSYVPAVVAYIKMNLASKTLDRERFMKEFWFRFHKAKEGHTSTPNVVIPTGPYKF
jgi:hypothetical protein